MLIDFRERGSRGRERERNIDVREKHQLVASHTCPDQGLNSQPTYLCIYWLIHVCALTRNQTHSLGILEGHSNQLSYLARAYLILFHIC